MEIVLLGNCQLDYIDTRLKFYLSSSNHSVILSTPVFMMKSEDVEKLHNDLSTSHVLITQPIGDSYGNHMGVGTNHLKSKYNHLEIIIIPNIYYDGFFPTYVYLKDYDNCTITARSPIWKNRNMPFSDYHDLLLITCSLLKLSKETVYSSLCKNDVHDFIVEKSQMSLWELQKRDESCDITAKDLLFSCSNDDILFHSFNHPSNSIMDRIAKKILQALGIRYHEPNCSDLGPEHLKNPKLLIPPCIAKPLNINPRFHKDRFFDIYDFYQETACEKDILELYSYNVLNNRSTLDLIYKIIKEE